MARDRLAARKAGQAAPTDSYNAPTPSSPPQQYPPSAGNPYAAQGQGQQTYTPVPGMGGGPQGQGGNPYAPPQQQQGQGGYDQGGYGAPGQGQGQYGQQDMYDRGGAGTGVVNGGGAGGSDFWSELTNTNNALNEMQDAIQQVRQAHVASLSRLDTTPNSAAARETDALVASTRALTSTNKNRIQALNKLAKDKAQKQQVQAAKSRFMGLLQEYQTVEKEFRKKVRERGERQYKIVKPDATQEEVNQVLETENPQIFSQALLNSNRYGDARGALREIQERNQDIKKIEKTLEELAQMFNEMAMLVEQQDETIATIETHANQVNTDMEAGLKHTEDAVIKARKARRKKWICFWISILILLIVAAIIVGVICGQGKC